MQNKFLVFLVICSLGFSYCNNELTDEEIKSNVRMYYMQMGLAAGSGSWKPNEVRVLKKEADKKEKDVWLITTETKGIYESPPLGNPVPDELFCDTLKFIFRQNEHDIWECNMAQ